ncbi:MAG: oxidoreductase [Bdellovibrionales bacterium GWC1_52_8]|nr:MAG: oxidoreductase [Bdellovibrionales bacterium GWA1_52_35]OFZ40818.1 MAG: oxidoreductase [Bdellovibrionales bacterium GWC1_52_8]HCM38504.1 oxidoreductase [Bdellovibrionales bacterium]
MIKSKPRLGFLGTGWIGRHRMKKIIESGAAEAALIYDPHSESLAEALKEVPTASPADSYDDFLSSDLDGIVIATPSAQHAEQSIQALQAGYAVFCQKPLGRTATEVKNVVAAAKSTDTFLGVDFSYRYTEGMKRIHSLINEGEIGEIHAVDLVFHNAYGPDKTWFYDPKQSGGGCVMDLGVHLVDLALWCLNFPKILESSSRLFTGGKPLVNETEQVEDFALAQLDCAGGTTFRLACSWRLPAGCDCVISADFYGSKGGLSFRSLNGSFYDFIAERFRGTAREVLFQAAPPGMDPPAEDWGGRAAVAWAKRLAEGTRFDPSCENLITVAGVLDRIYRR